jgi:uncharacterized membrane protein
MTAVESRNPTSSAGWGGAEVLGAAAAGAALMYFLDPDRGAKRRHLVIDQFLHAGHVAADAADMTARDLGNRARGLAAETRAGFADDAADDRVVEGRVRTELGRTVSHPSAITVTANQGTVTLSGRVLAAEVDELLRRVHDVRGVRGVENALEVHESAASAPALQGGTRRPGPKSELAQENWAPATRLLTAVGGGALAAYGLRRRDPVGVALGLAGLALLARGTTNTELGRLAGAGSDRRGVDLQKTINVNAPVEDVYAVFTDWQSWPQWMSHVRSVTASGVHGAVGERTHWVVDGPAGTTVSWDAEVMELVPNERVAWRSVDGAAVRHVGLLRFDRNADGSTRVDVRMSYNPPAGAVGHAVARLFGRDPRHQMHDDLARLKTTIETGVAPHDAAGAESVG